MRWFSFTPDRELFTLDVRPVTNKEAFQHRFEEVKGDLNTLNAALFNAALNNPDGINFSATRDKAAHFCQGAPVYHNNPA